MDKCNMACIISWLSGAVTGLIVLIFPLVYFFVSYQHMTGKVESEVEMIANNITQEVIGNNPELWQFGQTRLEEYLSYLLRQTNDENRRILNDKNELIAANMSGQVTPPLVIRSFPLVDSGVIVGRVEIARSLWPILKKTGMVSLLALPLGAGAYFIMSILPIRAIRRMEDALRKANEELEMKVQERTAELDDANKELQEEMVNRKLMEEQLRTLSCGIEQSPASIVITDLKGTIEYVNPKFAQLTGYNSYEAIGQNPSVLKSGLTPPAVYQQLWETILSGNEWHGEFCNKKKNGEHYWESASISPIVDASGQISRFIAVKEDITNRKHLEEERESLINALQEALANVKKLCGMLPICAACKKIRDDKGYWNQLEAYISDHSDVLFSHCLCPDCSAKAFKDLDELKVKYGK